MVLDRSRDRAVQGMFDRIARRYDLLNRVISWRLDHRWRNQVIRAAVRRDDQVIVDLGTGTGDLAFAAARLMRRNVHIVGLDFSPAMLQRARQKKCRDPHAAAIHFVLASALLSPFHAEVFDAAMTAFVLRNVSDLPLFFSDAYRVLKPGGRFVSMDMFPPSRGWFSPFYALYFYHLVPRIGALLAGDHKAYRYLSDSVRDFPSPEAVADTMRGCGFASVKLRKFLNGAVCMHTAEKLASPSGSR